MKEEAILVQRLARSNASLASQTIRDVKDEASSQYGGLLDSNQMHAWLANPANVLIVATDDGKGVGFALGYLLDRIDRPQPMLCFYEIEVAVGYRRRGIGRRLVEAMKAVARNAHAQKMWVQTGPENIEARALYQRTGGVEDASPDHVFSWSEGALSHLHSFSDRRRQT